MQYTRDQIREMLKQHKGTPYMMAIFSVMQQECETQKDRVVKSNTFEEFLEHKGRLHGMYDLIGVLTGLFNAIQE